MNARRSFERHVQRQHDRQMANVRREFQRSQLGRVVAQVDRLSRSASRGKVEATRRELERMQRAGILRDMPEVREALEAATDKYAARGVKDRMLATVLSAFGDFGDIVADMVSTSRATPDPSRLERELQAALNLVAAFRPELLSDEGRRSAGQTPEDQGFTRQPPAASEPQERQKGNWTTVQVMGRTRTYKNSDPMLTGAMINVASSNVDAIGFVFNWDQPHQGTLKVRFLQGRKQKVSGPTYFYYGVHPDVFESFQRAASKGTFVWDRLRVRGSVSAHRYHYELMAIRGGYVPRKAARFGPNEYFVGRQFRAQSNRTGQIRTFESALPDRRVGKANTGSPEIGTPRRGAPRRGAPSRGL